MNAKFSFLSLLLLVLLSTQTSFAKDSSETLALQAVSEDSAEASMAIEDLRARGPAGLRILMNYYAIEIKDHIAYPTATDVHWQRLSAALDAVAQQKNSYISGLYWYTDLDAAKKLSAETNKPILSLRLLGKLTDELSCANSRFFRTVLYSNADISAFLRDNFVLHWQSVRPVPTVTIDYGDGRRLERTLTGNSIHYILDSQGRVIEALPGLNGPKVFARWLCNSADVFSKLAGQPERVREVRLPVYYRFQQKLLLNDWTQATVEIGGKAPEGFIIEKDAHGALSIAPLAVTKAATETTILRAMTQASEALGRITDEAAWRKIAQLRSSLAVLDERSISLIKRQNPTLSDEEFARLLKKFQELIALDTVRNEYLLHSKLYVWLMRDLKSNQVDKLNGKVYAELFLTPQSDPWLGLFSSDVYTALDNGGVVRR